ncbi:Eukaryotic translation initiation factor 2-alpha kinase, partial [Rhizophlyctis rosea]
MGTLENSDTKSSLDTKFSATRRSLKSYTSFEDALRSDRRLAPITRFDDTALRNVTNSTQSHSESESTLSSNPAAEFGSPPTTVLSSALIRQTKAIQQREKERRLRQSRLLLVSLLENFCALYDDSDDRTKLFYIICKQLSAMGIIESEDFLDELSGVRASYKRAFRELVVQAMAAIKDQDKGFKRLTAGDSETLASSDFESLAERSDSSLDASLKDPLAPILAVGLPRSLSLSAPPGPPGPRRRRCRYSVAQR